MLGLSRLKISLMTSAGVGGSFSPSRLFASGEPGGWYDIDPAYLYQDSAGTTPVTAPGQTVGMVLDRSKGLVRGADVITNGNFATDTWWGKDSAWTISGGVATYSGATSNQLYTPASTLVTGLLYEVTFDVTAVTTAGSLPVVSQTTLTLNVTTTGTYTAWVFASADGRLRFGSGSGSTWRGSIDNVVCRVIAGNHLTQSTLSNRAIYGIEPFGGRRNLLTYTEQFDNAAWSKSATGTLLRNETDPLGVANSATTLVADNAGGAGQVYAQQAFSTVSGATYAMSVYLKQGTQRYAAINIFTGFSNTVLWFDLQAGTSGVISGSGATTNISSVGNGWYRCTVVSTATTTTAAAVLRVAVADDNTDGNYITPRNGTSSILIWGAQLELGSTATAYQRVTDQWNVTEAGKTSVGYLQFDGSDDWLVSPTITPGIDKAQVFAGVRKLSDAAAGIVVESSANRNTNNGAFTLVAPGNVAANYGFGTKGTNDSFQTATTYTAPITNVLTGIGDIAADTAILRINGAQAASSAADQGTGNYLAYPLYVGRRGGTTLPYNGRIYSLIVRFGANLDAATIAATEAYVNSKTGAY